MRDAFGYTVAIVVAAAALRRLPVELRRWRVGRRCRSLQTARAERADAGWSRRRAPARGRWVVPGWLRRALAEASVACTVPQAVAVWGTAVAVGALAGGVLGRAPLAVAGAAAGIGGPPVVLWSMRRRHERLVLDALPDFLERVARSLRAGVATVTAMEEARPADGPLAADLGEVLSDVAAGRSLSVALEGWRDRCRLAEINLATAALSIGAAAGGRRAPAVDGVAATLRENEAARREVAALAVQGRLSGLLIALLPLGFLALSAMVDGATLGVLYRTPLGLVCLAGGLGLNAVAFVWMHRITRLR